MLLQEKKWRASFGMLSMHIARDHLIPKYILESMMLSPYKWSNTVDDTEHVIPTWWNQGIFSLGCDAIPPELFHPFPLVDFTCRANSYGLNRGNATHLENASGDASDMLTHYILMSVTQLGSMACCVACGLWLVTNSSMGHTTGLWSRDLTGSEQTSLRPQADLK